MDYTCYNMNAYNLHIINTDKFKTITVDVSFRRKINKNEITIRNLLKELMVNSSFSYPSERSLIVQTEKLFDLNLIRTKIIEYWLSKNVYLPDYKWDIAPYI